MNRTRLVQEAARQGQAETEMRMIVLKGMTGQGNNNPLIKFYETDPVIRELTLDTKGMRSLMRQQCVRSPLCWCPLFWFHSAILCFPCSSM